MGFGTVEHQKEVARKIGYDVDQWNPDNEDQCRLLFQLAMKAQFSGEDCNGNVLSEDDLILLSVITGRG